MSLARAWLRRSGLLCLLAAFSCASGAEYTGPLPSPDGRMFVEQVYPLLLRDCAFVACHDQKERFLQVYGPGRLRMPPASMSAATRVELDYGDPANIDEVLSAYERARSMLVSTQRVEESLLLQKPLEPEAGGQGHKGVDELGRNLFASQRDRRWQLLYSWATSEGEPPTAQQVGALNDATANAANTEAGP